jgi:hypothetical protein
MFLRISSLFFLFGSLSLLSDQQEIPCFIDFGTDEFSTHFFNQKFSPETVTTCPFNCALEMSTFFMYIKDEFQIETVIETGTFKGNTTAFLGSLFNTVHTIEIAPDFYTESLAFLQQYPNVCCHFGSSPVVLQQILPSLSNQRVLFYLDAHWLADWPLLDELKQISKTHRNNCIIVIDDFKVPGRSDVPYDTHGNNEYSFEYVKKSIDRIFTGYTIHYLIPRDVNSRAKFVAMPKKWSQNKK